MYKIPFFRRQQEVRGDIPSTYSYDFPPKIRNQFLMLWKVLSFLHINDVYKQMCLELGVLFLCNQENSTLSDNHYINPAEEVINYFLTTQDSEHALTIVEFAAYYCNNNIYEHHNGVEFIEAINGRFQHERIGYKLVINEQSRDVNLLRIEDELFFKECTTKSLGILSVHQYIDAQQHYINAYKKLAEKDYDNSLIEIGRAIESILKTRFTKLNITFDLKKDALNKLLDIAQNHMISNTHDFQYFKQVILDAGRARNTSGHGHAQGQTPQLDEIYVRFIINQAAANMLFLAEVGMQP
jgi:hypothetical protein